MFSGIIEGVGRIAKIISSPRGRALTIETGLPVGEMVVGESVCVSGVCLTVTAKDKGEFSVDVVPESLRRTTLGELGEGDEVNLERSLRLGDRMSGHLVFGHVDGMGVVADVEPDGESQLYTFAAPEEVTRYTVEKGSVAIDGISLTVFHCQESSFTVAIVPHTARVTTIGKKKVGDRVNLESDMMAKYMEKLVHEELERMMKLQGLRRSDSKA